MPRFAPLVGYVMLMGSMLGTAGCGSNSLHPSFGQLYRDVNIAQASAHPAHEPTVRGQEINSVIQSHDKALVPNQNASGGGGGQSLSTAGVAPLH